MAARVENSQTPAKQHKSSCQLSDPAWPPLLTRLTNVSIRRPCALVVSAQASPRERNPALMPVIAAGGRVQQVAGGSRVTVTTRCRCP